MKGAVCIGANLGQEVEGWIALGVENMILFEPVSETFQKLERIMSNKKGYIILMNKAIGNIKGKIKMNIEKSHQGKSCSILKPKLHLQQYPDIEFIGEEWVNIDKLDNIAYNRELYDHLHIDTQGYEIEVLKGAEKSLKFFKTIQVEVYREELYENCALYEDVIAYLHDFKLVNVIWRGNTWGDATFKRI
jgi:FkbM family methyltransferase